MKKTDAQLKRDIEEELRWDPKVNEAQIGVTVKGGMATLMGTVDSYAEKWAADDAAWRVGGVHGVDQELSVKLLPAHVRNDADIAAAATNALGWDVFIPSGISAKVSSGTLTLSGEVPWNFQRESAERAVRYLPGVTSVKNDITLKQRAVAAQVKEQVSAALQRQATTDSNNIKIETSGNRVTLSGHASSWKSIDDATVAAWGVPGVNEVIDHVQIQ
jgi:osmotically-inducible protein OsmY